MKDRAPYILAGVPVLECKSCTFLCSDESYLTVHNMVEHSSEPSENSESRDEKSPEKISQENLLAAIKALKSTRRKKEIEQAIESTSKTLSLLYTALLQDNAQNVDEASKLISNPVSGTISPSLEINHNDSPEIPRSTPFSGLPIPGPVSPPDSEKSQSRKRKMSEETTSLNLSEGTPAFTSQSTVTPAFGGFSTFQANIAGMNQMERARAIIETIKKARLNQAENLDDDEEEPVVVQPTGPPGFGPEPSDPGSVNTGPNTSTDNDVKNDSDADEIIEIPIDESEPAPSMQSIFPASFRNPAGLHNLINSAKNNNTFNQSPVSFPPSDQLSRLRPPGSLPIPLLGTNLFSQIQKKPGPPTSKSDAKAPIVSVSGSLVPFSSGSNAISPLNSAAMAPKNLITCQICGSNWRTPSALNIHMRVHTGEKPYKCMICGKGHKQKGQLKVHINKHHPGQWPVFGSMMNQMIKDPKKCSMCGECFNEPKELSKHILECAPSGIAIPPGHPRPSCDICGLTFTSTLNFKKHMDSHRLENNSKSESPTGEPEDLNSNESPKPEITPKVKIPDALLNRLKSHQAMNPTLLNSFPTNIFTGNLSGNTAVTGFSAIQTPIKAVTVTVGKPRIETSEPAKTSPILRVSPTAVIPTTSGSGFNGTFTGSSIMTSVEKPPVENISNGSEIPESGVKV